MFHINRSDIRFSIPDDENFLAQKIKKIAAKAGRATTNEKEEKVLLELINTMEPLSVDDLNIWAVIMMIDHRWCGATGQGGYWAKASDFCNRAALYVLSKRPKFEVVTN